MTGAGAREGVGDDRRQLVDQVAAVLSDPDLHTDLRMRLARQIEQLLVATGSSSGTPREPGEPPPDDAQLIAWLDAVLVDPEVHTDMRLRLRRNILELLEAPCPGRSEDDSKTGGRQAESWASG